MGPSEPEKVATKELTKEQIKEIEKMTGRPLGELDKEEIQEILDDWDAAEESKELVNATSGAKTSRIRQFDNMDFELDLDEVPSHSPKRARHEGNGSKRLDAQNVNASRCKGGRDTPMFTVSPSQTVISKLPKKRFQLVRTQHNVATLMHHSVNSSLPPSSLPPSSSSPLRTQDDQSEPPRTPPNRRPAQSKKVTFGQQTPSSKSILKHAHKIVQVNLAIANEFPSEEDIDMILRGCFKQAAKDLDATTLITRMKNDNVYEDNVISCYFELKHSLSQICGEVKMKAQMLVESHYEIRSADGVDVVKSKVQKLLSRSSFLFKDMNKRVGFYDNEIINELIAKQWFDKTKRSSDGIPFTASFNPIPILLLALVSTANLKKKAAENPKFFDDLCRDLFECYWKFLGNAPLKTDVTENKWDDIDLGAERAHLSET
ncbi:hypothetical protein NEOLEDRAFT_1179091 [Neolentinus lepideus HHB14362 ss-1]|uniref:DUF6532 domain-containing protein n=1 Tax=Neolentinus lepideus HHB14362 ss-1 TaxID=1314782 RepID=A0A165S6N9_9AGAM|nr:hypothetical protein NEOLEDRAFT_1179091 [Neolentinus lepideus HHB14362 ss-1]